MEILTNQAIEIVTRDIAKGEYRVLGSNEKFHYLGLYKTAPSLAASFGRGKRTFNHPEVDEGYIYVKTAKVFPIRRKKMTEWIDKNYVVEVPTPLSNTALDSAEKYEDMIEENAKIMALFLDATERIKCLSQNGSFAPLFNKIREEHRETCSDKRMYELFYKLLKFGFHKHSLLPAYENCGKPGVPRPVEEGGSKPGRKPVEVEYAIRNGLIVPPQYGMTGEWRKLVLDGWKKYKDEKNSFSDFYISLIKNDFHNEISKISENEQQLAAIPSEKQVRYCIETNVDILNRRKSKTTSFNYEQNHRALLGSSSDGRSLPGHTYAIDSTLLDIFLVSSLDRSRVVGRPVLYLLVDVASGAIVGFYLTLHGQNWESVKVALFNTLYDPSKMAKLLGVNYKQTFITPPGLPQILLSDRGEYLSRNALETCKILELDQDIVRAYRGDLKGIVEVQFHHIKKEYYYQPGAHLIHRKELELRKSKPLDAKYTLQEYARILYSQIWQYNLTANVAWRLTSEMKARAVKAYPAAIWNHGFSIGHCYNGTISEDTIIRNLLPSYKVSATAEGIGFNERDYGDQDNSTDVRLATLARSKVQKVNIWSHPCNIQNIWTSQGLDHGLRSVPQSLKDSSFVSEDEFQDIEYEYKHNSKLDKHPNLQVGATGLSERQDQTAVSIAASKLAHSETPISKKNLKDTRRAENDFFKPSDIGASEKSAKPTITAVDSPKSNFSDFLSNKIGGSNG